MLVVGTAYNFLYLAVFKLADAVQVTTYIVSSGVTHIL